MTTIRTLPDRSAAGGSPRVAIVPLGEVDAARLEPIWRRERRLWAERLDWDVSAPLRIVRQAVVLETLPGRVLLVDGRAAGYGYYLVEGPRAVIGGLAFAEPDLDRELGGRLVAALVEAARREASVRRIETQFVDFDQPWLAATFAALGFDEHPRLVLRRELGARADDAGAQPAVHDVALEPWRRSWLGEAARLLQRAHAGRADAAMNELYRSREGCRVLLGNILDQHGCGRPLPEASFVARDASGRLVGVVLCTSIGFGHAHIAQIAVAPEAEGRGLGRRLLAEALAALEGRRMRVVSLMVSAANRRARELYRAAGFRTALAFAVFSWEGERRGPRPR